jgi:hypothetical protein
MNRLKSHRIMTFPFTSVCASILFTERNYNYTHQLGLKQKVEEGEEGKG